MADGDRARLWAAGRSDARRERARERHLRRLPRHGREPDEGLAHHASRRTADGEADGARVREAPGGGVLRPPKGSAPDRERRERSRLQGRSRPAARASPRRAPRDEGSPRHGERETVRGAAVRRARTEWPGAAPAAIRSSAEATRANRARRLERVRSLVRFFRRVPPGFVRGPRALVASAAEGDRHVEEVEGARAGPASFVAEEPFEEDEAVEA